MSDERFARNELFFGEEGQYRLRQTVCAVVGVGGLGTHVVQQLALLGVGGVKLIDAEDLAETNKNRYVGVWHDDPIGSRKVDLAERLVTAIDPTIQVEKVPDTLVSEAGFQAVRTADFVLGCLDCEGARLILTELCSAYARPYIDAASDIDPKADPPIYGGRVCSAVDGRGCLVCLDVLDREEAGRDLEGDAGQRNRETLYGVPRDALGRSGPSVVSINGVVASMAVNEFMVAVTGLRQPKPVVTYYGHTGKATVDIGPPRQGCWPCSLWGCDAAAGVERYLQEGVGQFIR